MVNHGNNHGLPLFWYLRFMTVSLIVANAQFNENASNVVAAKRKSNLTVKAQTLNKPDPQIRSDWNVELFENRNDVDLLENRNETENVVYDSGVDTEYDSNEVLHFANESDVLEYIPWDELHIVKIVTTTPHGVRKSAGALVRERIVVTCCRCISLTVLPYPISSRGVEEFIEVSRGVTGETRFVDRMSFGIRSYCIDDPETNIAVVLILTQPFHVDPMHFHQGPMPKSCRFYAFSKKFASDHSILGHQDLRVLVFLSGTRICQNDTGLTDRDVVCGSVLDDEKRFCELRPGAVVICDYLFAGVSQTSCQVPYFHSYHNETQVLAYVSIFSRYSIRYWIKLVTLMKEGSGSFCISDKADNPLLVTLFIIAVNAVNLCRQPIF